jgi:hypothetical protein
MNAPFLRRTKDQKRKARLLVVAGALDLFRKRRSNIAKRNRLAAEDMRFAGAEAEFCLSEVRNQIASADWERRMLARIRESKRATAAAMEPEARSARISAILDEIELLPYRPLSVNVAQRKAALVEELEFLGEASDAAGSAGVDQGLARAVETALFPTSTGAI